MSTQPPCEFLDWDSEFFACRIARATAEVLNTDTLNAVLNWCKAHDIACLYFLADADHDQSLELAQDHGFNPVDRRVTLATPLPQADSGQEDQPTQGICIRPVETRDIAHLSAIARRVHRDTRFYLDPQFPNERCDALYALWIEKSCADYADHVLVAEYEGQAAGYLTCTLNSAQGQGQIGLVGVGEQARGHGLARALVRAGLDWFEGQGMREVHVVTQGRNEGAQRLYQRSGFSTEAVRLWYHKWFV